MSCCCCLWPSCWSGFVEFLRLHLHWSGSNSSVLCRYTTGLLSLPLLCIKIRFIFQFFNCNIKDLKKIHPSYVRNRTCQSDLKIKGPFFWLPTPSYSDLNTARSWSILVCGVQIPILSPFSLWKWIPTLLLLTDTASKVTKTPRILKGFLRCLKRDLTQPGF